MRIHVYGKFTIYIVLGTEGSLVAGPWEVTLGNLIDRDDGLRI